MLPARRHDISRREAFSGAVFAFTLTLPVVSLDVYDELMALIAGFVPAHWIFGRQAIATRVAAAPRV
jgi:hypothetical protein